MGGPDSEMYECLVIVMLPVKRVETSLKKINHRQCMGGSSSYISFLDFSKKEEKTAAPEMGLFFTRKVI